MTSLIGLLDVVLAISLVAVGWQALASEDPFRAIALFVAFGLLMTLAWVRLDVIDVALAEAGIGTGFTGALFFVALAHLRRQDERRRSVGPPQGKD